MKVHSRDFSDNGFIPSKYTCDGDDISPPIEWSEVPSHTKSLALIMDDPDAPAGTWIHWIVFNLPQDSKCIEENCPREGSLPDGTYQGRNSWGQIGYGGPCPPSGTHRYFFKLYALDIKLDVEAGATKIELIHAMEGHILDQTDMVGLYQRKK